MRTTLEIDDDVMSAAQDLARLKKQGLGRTISELVRSGLTISTAKVEMQDGIPIWVHQAKGVPVTNELVRNLAEDD